MKTEDYWIYIYDFKEKIWRKYSGGYVTKIQDENDVLGRKFVHQESRVLRLAIHVHKYNTIQYKKR